MQLLVLAAVVLPLLCFCVQQAAAKRRFVWLSLAEREQGNTRGSVKNKICVRLFVCKQKVGG